MEGKEKPQLHEATPPLPRPSVVEEAGRKLSINDKKSDLPSISAK